MSVHLRHTFSETCSWPGFELESIFLLSVAWLSLHSCEKLWTVMWWFTFPWSWITNPGIKQLLLLMYSLEGKYYLQRFLCWTPCSSFTCVCVCVCVRECVCSEFCIIQHCGMVETLDHSTYFSQPQHNLPYVLCTMFFPVLVDFTDLIKLCCQVDTRFGEKTPQKNKKKTLNLKEHRVPVFFNSMRQSYC